MAKRDLALAVAACREEIQRARGAHRPWLLLLRVLGDAGALEEAQGVVEEAAAHGVNTPQLHVAAARLARQARDWLRAALELQRAIDMDPSVPAWYIQQGHDLERCRSWAAAGESFGEFARRVTQDEVDARLTLERRVFYDLTPRASYAYLVTKAALLASKLGYSDVTVVELGVAGGRGLLQLEAYAAEVESTMDIEVKVVGFDTGRGLPTPEGLADVPHYFSEGSYAMKEDELRRCLVRSELILGDVRETFARFLGGLDVGRLGAIAFDLDYYSSTKAVLDLLAERRQTYPHLPRLYASFDDLFAKHRTDLLKDYSPDLGEQRAIDEFNAVEGPMRLRSDRYFAACPRPSPWHRGMFVLHDYDHEDYRVHIGGHGPSTLALSPE